MAGISLPLYRNYDLEDEVYETVEWDEEYQLPTASSFTWNKPGYTFKEWNTARDGSGTGYDPGDTTEGETLYAIWEAIEGKYLDAVGLAQVWGKAKEKFIDTAIYYGTCSTAAGTATKAVVCASFTASALKAGAAILVRFSATNSAAVADIKLNVNSTGAKSIKYINNGTLGNLGNAGYLKASTAYLFVYDGTYWVVYLNYNSNTTYSAMTSSEAQTGTATSARTITASVLKGAIKYHAPAIPTDVSAFNNDAGYLTLADLPIWDGGVE